MAAALFAAIDTPTWYDIIQLVLNAVFVEYTDRGIVRIVG